ncbi:MAG: SirA family protein [Chloroflexi bacterium]|jgi:tRNA 2-thiouridine synthesizing protein A|nr:SirA family protein [Chloroflexota bacterium]
MNQTITIDASGLSCPQPVLLTKQAIQQAKQGTVIVLVDSSTSRDNCSRIAEKAGWSVVVTDRPAGGYRLVLSK